MAGTFLTVMDPCLSDAELGGLIDGEGIEADVEAHLSNCQSCQDRLDAMAGKLPIVSGTTECRQIDSNALDTAMRELKASPLDEKRDLEWWLASVGAEGAKGDLLGVVEGYELRRVIGEGGMGLVLEAHDPRLDRLVAIKLIKPSLVSGQHVRERLLREASAAARIGDDRVIPIYAAELTSIRRVPFIVMPYVAHGTLQDRMDAVGGPLPVEEVISLGRQIAAALAAAHAAGVIHRDIKPANVLMRGDGQVWVTDFGIARALDDERGEPVREVSGTPAFMAPEQTQGQVADHRADLFSLGAVLYGMATGQPAFSGDSSIPHQPVAEANPGLPSWLGGCIDQLLEKDPASRPQTADKVVRALSPEARSDRRDRRPVVIACFLAVGILALLLGSKYKPAWQAAPFVISAQKLGFHSLPEAIAAAAPGAVIEVQQSGVIYRGVLEVLDKPLGIRAVNGAQPQIQGVMGMNPLLSTRAPLLLEGIHFFIDCDASGGITTGPTNVASVTPPLIDTAGPLAVTNCIFAHVRDSDTSSRLQAALILLNDAGPCRFTNSIFVNRASASLALDGSHADLTLDNCLLLSQTGLLPRRLDSDSTAITLRRCAAHVREFALWREKFALEPIAFAVSESVLDTELAVFGLPGRNLASVRGMIHFRGERNLYNVDTVSYVSFYNPVRGPDPPLHRFRVGSFEDWSRFVEHGESDSQTVPMRFMETHADRLRADVSEGLRHDLKSSLEFPDIGIDQAVLGVGEGYVRFLKTESSDEWRRFAEAFLSSVMPH